MTSKLTREQLRERTQRKVKHLAAAISQSAFTGVRVKLEEELQIAEFALSCLESEPVAWTDEQELRDVDRGGCGYLFTVNPVTPHADERRVIKLFTTPQPAPVVPEEWTISDAVKFCKETGRQDAVAAMDAWNACRAAMLNPSPDAVENDSPVIPDGWVLVPVEPTADMYEAGDQQLATKQVWDSMIAAAPQEVTSARVHPARDEG
ncbi:TPA: hypothetical protein QEG37_002012 [Pluralibacter gergoviae]|nr:hypothetical protein [Pluralibacter gergoviae]HDS1241435.1 hypothetical protein [Pluralibacter gergoviae]HDS1248966.1 hypothetical protein [Pluralibacter gergoviae]HDS1254158.1 hypothetical protein [Pluralibacter gergoviae]HDS1257621.1 hypothetical protein [Pluralibacter gergoviae]